VKQFGKITFPIGINKDYDPDFQVFINSSRNFLSAGLVNPLPITGNAATSSVVGIGPGAKDTSHNNVNNNI
jgi:hypothetical protein